MYIFLCYDTIISGDIMKKGILLPVFSLPSKYGIGDFGKEAREFINILRDNNIEYWEILPINECGKYPYAPISYYALNKNYISIDLLIEFMIKSMIILEAFNSGSSSGF
jgi:4-alpha-glucanotransferase